MALTGVAWPSPSGLLLLLYLGVGCSAVAFALCAYGLRHLTAAQNALFGTLELPVGLAAALLLSEPLGAHHLGGAALVLLGIWLATERHGNASRPSRVLMWTERRSRPASHPFRLALRTR